MPRIIGDVGGARGRVSIRLWPNERATLPDGVSIYGVSIDDATAADGTYAYVLHVTDTLIPADQTYRVIETSPTDGTLTTRYITVPTGTADGTTVASLAVSDPGDVDHNVPAGGTTGQVLNKASDADYATAWTTLTAVTATKTADYAANSGELVPGDASAGDFSVTLPAPTNGATVVVTNVAATGVVTVLPHVAETIDGKATYPLRWGYRQQAQEFVADGTNWRTVIAQPTQEHIVFPFAFDTAGLDTGVVVPGWTPAVGDLVFDLMMDIPTQWNVTAKGDLYFLPDPGGPDGVWAVGSGSGLHIAMDQANSPQGSNFETFNLPRLTGSPLRIVGAGSAPTMVVSADGTPGGGDPGAAEGAATLHLLVLPA